MENYSIASHIEAFPYETKKLNIFNRNTGKSYILGEKEAQVFVLLNGVNSIAEIHKKCSFYSVEDIENLISAFADIGFFDKKKKFNPLKIQIRLFNPNKLIKENSLLSKILYRLVMICFPLLFFAGVITLHLKQPDTMAFFNSVIPGFNDINIFNVIIIIVLSILCLSLHELAHMITARYYGVNVPEIGIMLYYLIPCAYTNISGINLLKSKVKRLIVLLSGSLINIGLIGVCFIVMSLAASPNIIIICISLSIVNIGTIFMNTLVFLKFDGYYMLETLMNEPKFREKAMSHITELLRVIFSKKTVNKKAVLISLKKDEMVLSHLCYCFYSVISIAYVPFVLMNTVAPFILK